MKEVEYVYASMYVYYKLRGLYDVLCLATAPTYANNQIFVSWIYEYNKDRSIMELNFNSFHLMYLFNSSDAPKKRLSNVYCR